VLICDFSMSFVVCVVKIFDKESEVFTTSTESKNFGKTTFQTISTLTSCNCKLQKF
jgi:hypothetical protein